MPAPTSRRRTLLKLIGGAGALITMPTMSAQPSATALHKRVIPKSRELLPVIGLGTYIVFDAASNACRPGTSSPAANTWIWNLLSVISATCFASCSPPP